MSQRIPDRLDPWRYADLGKAVSGTIRLDSMPRLSQCLHDTGGEASFELSFERDARHRAVLIGSLRSELTLECQRCLEAVTVPVESDVSIAFVEGIEQAGRLPETLDPCLVEEGRVQFRDLIEDELLLMLPQVAMHDAGACKIRLADQSLEAPAEQDSSSRKNPFAVLAGLKHDKD
jgi:uncharacterized protein